MHSNHAIVIHIDKHEYRVPDASMTGLQLRSVPPTPIAPEFDLWEEVPGGIDTQIRNDQTYSLKSGMHFFTAPSDINPG
jgi:hypothetical protein